MEEEDHDCKDGEDDANEEQANKVDFGDIVAHMDELAVFEREALDWDRIRTLSRCLTALTTTSRRFTAIRTSSGAETTSFDRARALVVISIGPNLYVYQDGERNTPTCTSPIATAQGRLAVFDDQFTQPINLG